MSAALRPLLTIGRGAATQDEILARLTSAGVDTLVDIRRYPGSRAHPHVSRDALAPWLGQAGISYRWESRLGGRRRLPKDVESPDSWWTVEAFRAYAAYTRTAQFIDALDEVLEQAADHRVAVMCSETVWWRCHRRPRRRCGRPWPRPAGSHTCCLPVRDHTRSQLAPGRAEMAC